MALGGFLITVVFDIGTSISDAVLFHYPVWVSILGLYVPLPATKDTPDPNTSGIGYEATWRGGESVMEVVSRKLPGWARALAVAVGLVTLVAGFLVLVFPALGILFVVYMLAFALILLGVERLGMGITGHAYTVTAKSKEPEPAKA
jgi:hypothetical protein